MRCGTVQKYLVGYLDGGIPEQLRNEIVGHLSACSRCQHEITEQVGIRDLMHAIPPLVRDEKFWTTLEQSITESLPKRREPRQEILRIFPISIRRPRFAFGGLAFVVLLIVLGVLLGGRSFMEKSYHPAKVTLNGEEVEFYLEEHDLTQGGTAFTQSSFAGVVIGADHSLKGGKSK